MKWLSNRVLPVVGVALVLQSCTRAPTVDPTPQPPTLATGTWPGNAAPPDGGLFDLTVEVTNEGDSLSATLVAPFGRVPLHDIRVSETQLQFWFDLGQRIKCVLERQEDRGYAGPCVDEGGSEGRLTMRPPETAG